MCPACSRWNLTPLEDRWETLEACERAVRDEGRIRVRTENLSLVEVDEGGLIRIGSPPRSEFVDWRYGPRLPAPPPRGGLWARFLTRFLARLPEPPPEGYDPYRGIFGVVDQTPWLASPFLGVASSLTYLFSQLPLAPGCPSCARPLALRPWDFQRIRLLTERPGPALLAQCALCGAEVVVPIREARPVLRLGLGLVTPSDILQAVSAEAASVLDRAGDPERFIANLASDLPTLGELANETRAGLLIALDEGAEAEALESEWREAEELAAIVDGELTEIPGFEDFRREILRDED
ncbi:MAG: hypothetical protein ACWGSQ_12090 [Longimicrobiales bacterium]